MAAVGCFSVLLFASCTRTQPSLPPLPTGTQTFTGTLLPSPLSLENRGSHLLSEYVGQFVLESSVKVLRNSEHKYVVVSGTFEHNTRPEGLPVLVVSDIRNAVNEALTTWRMKSTGLTLSVPETWEQEGTEQRTSFFIPISEAKATLDVYSSATYAATGSVVSVGGRRSTLVNEPDRSFVVIPNQENVIILSLDFASVAADQRSRLKEDWLALLRTASFATSVSSAKPVTGTGANMPCGGSAGILCTPGFFCNITDKQSNTGLCKAIR